jgi:hypothetical protein
MKLILTPTPLYRKPSKPRRDERPLHINRDSFGSFRVSLRAEAVRSGVLTISTGPQSLAGTTYLMLTSFIVAFSVSARDMPGW